MHTSKFIEENPREDLGLVHIRALAIPKHHRKCEVCKRQVLESGRNREKWVSQKLKRHIAQATNNKCPTLVNWFIIAFILLLSFICLSLTSCIFRYLSDICFFPPLRSSQLSFVYHFPPHIWVHLNGSMPVHKSCDCLENAITGLEWSVRVDKHSRDIICVRII